MLDQAHGTSWFRSIGSHARTAQISPFSPIFRNLLMILATKIRLSTENTSASTRHWAARLIAVKPVPSIFPIFRAFPQVFPEYATYFQEIRRGDAIYRQRNNLAIFSMISTFSIMKAPFFFQFRYASACKR
jgi:hypothetical protein